MYKKEEGRLVVPSAVYPETHELATAEYLVSLGKRVTFIAPVRTKGIRTPDIFMDGVYWEMKSPVKGGRWAVEVILRKAIHKSGNIILDVCRIGAGYDDAVRVAGQQFVIRKRIRRLMVVDSSGAHKPLVLRKK